ncbi:MAG: adenylate kinase [Deltaproteobacteria bacterium CG_4_10_14_0_2_um_filter_43_8]|nr:MAG: adenylate kinase [Deltaproteobacteria bacterium CG11_big_fil_rev_8_21_14_0_20_42_23]PJA21588.1 MAG: adenylate kinase [Deltaproteobacteria bacterium CG_4_10_14_0_2_um_filter_43_8]PJC64616.1 MAG: adenylate kinase [Deltaproteobacteria bacterium CG_4_9_14_0_2_um_filter_42_21]
MGKGPVRMFFLGAPGSGKGTQGRLLSEYFSIVHLSTGDILRREVAKKSELGKKVSSVMSEGKLVDDELMNHIIIERLKEEDCSRGYILDGYPRTASQARALDALLKEQGQKLLLALYLNVPDEEIIKRLSCRKQEEGRSDDGEDTVHFRIDLYKSATQPLMGFYREQGLMHEVCGLGGINEVFSRILKCVESLREVW